MEVEDSGCLVHMPSYGRCGSNRVDSGLPTIHELSRCLDWKRRELQFWRWLIQGNDL